MSEDPQYMAEGGVPPNLPVALCPEEGQGGSWRQARLVVLRKEKGDGPIGDGSRHDVGRLVRGVPTST